MNEHDHDTHDHSDNDHEAHDHDAPQAASGLDLVGIRFVEAGPVSYCRPGNFDLGTGDYVVVRTDRGERLGWVVISPDQVLAGTAPAGPLRLVDRIATEDDVRAWEQGKQRAAEDRGRAQALAARNDPRVRVASVTYDLAERIADVTFTAPERVEYRWLEQQLADLLTAEVHVTQVGDRDRAKAAGGLGVCGLALCCSTWMTEFPSISIKMAKEQDLPPNPSKISGVCGRLLCCLSFEVEAYRELRGDLPKVGKRVTTPAGRAKVLSVNSLQQMVRLRFDETGEVIEIPADELRQQYGTAVRPEELEAQIEEPLRRRSRQLSDNLVAAIAPVYRETQHIEPAANPGRPETFATAEVDDSTDEPSEAGDTELGPDGEPRRRRRRGRRGGRGRNRSGEGTSDTPAE